MTMCVCGRPIADAADLANERRGVCYDAEIARSVVQMEGLIGKELNERESTCLELQLAAALADAIGKLGSDATKNMRVILPHLRFAASAMSVEIPDGTVHLAIVGKNATTGRVSVSWDAAEFLRDLEGVIGDGLEGEDGVVPMDKSVARWKELVAKVEAGRDR